MVFYNNINWEINRNKMLHNAKKRISPSKEEAQDKCAFITGHTVTIFQGNFNKIYNKEKSATWILTLQKS